ncbi:MAG TPA: YceD family protein [Pseudomonadales bacterium]|nr:YceD family protein [Pseudomonadales bacterium]
MRSLTTNQLLPGSVDALKLCQQGVNVSGFLPLAGLQRLSSQLYVQEGIVQVELVFGRDEQSRKTITGHIEAVLPLVCQRCLERLDVDVASELSLALVWSEDQVVQLPRALDPVVMDGEDLDLHDIVEEELLLALPLVAIHEVGTCEPPQLLAVEQLIDSEPVEKKVNPFKVLAALKTEAKPTE